jgi:hypothetical protein
MINKEMKETKSEKDSQNSKDTKKPNELGGVYFSSSIKISDPETNEVLVHVRGDN